MVNIGYIILKEFERVDEDRLSLVAITSLLKKRKIVQYRPVMFALMFLYSTGAIDFKAPYFYKI